MALVKQIPRGKVATYGQIAALAGKPGAARGVGWILSSSAKTHKLPWQRVINAKGRISFPKKNDLFAEQKKLLSKDGVRVSADGEVSLNDYGWAKKPPPTRAKPYQPKMFS